MTSKTLAPSKPVEKNQTPDRHGTAEADDVLSQVVSFRLAKEEYGLDIMRIQEIILMGDITQIPEVPDYICGLINLRRKVIPIVDLRKRFCLEAGDTTEHTRIMVVNTRTTTFGIVVDAVSQVLRIEADQIEPPPPGLVGLEQAYIQGLVKMQEKIMILLNVDAVLSHEVKTQLAEAGESRAS